MPAGSGGCSRAAAADLASANLAPYAQFASGRALPVPYVNLYALNDTVLVPTIGDAQMVLGNGFVMFTVGGFSTVTALVAVALPAAFVTFTLNV